MQELFTDTNICLSGGAKGADKIWGQCASAKKFQVIHWSFVGHKHHVPNAQVYVLNDDLLCEADPHLVRANRTLQRKWPVRNWNTANLLRRNYYQVAWSDSIYAVSHIDEYGQVSGGTAWAVQMFIDLHPDKPAYLYDQLVKDWYEWKDGWQRISAPPPPEGVFAGVGKRDLNEHGEKAIYDLMN